MPKFIKSLTNPTHISFNHIKDTSNELINSIESHKELLWSLLQNFESYEVFHDEVFKSIDTLKNIELEKEYLVHTVDLISTILPINLPLYSLILFAVVPSFVSKKVVVRVPTVSRNIVADIFKILELPSNIVVADVERKIFTEKYVAVSDVVIFTGTYANAQKVQLECKPTSLFLFNGAGVNPVVINADADVEESVDQVIRLKLFNNGQDCAGPDSILIHEDIAQKFINTLVQKLKIEQSGFYSNKSIKVGPINKVDHCYDVVKYLVKNREHIIYGGEIDFKNAIIKPTVIVKNLGNENTYDELFAPIFNLLIYSNQNNLDTYFANETYQKYKMYISIFGSDDIIKGSFGIKLKNTIIMDHERGNKAFGGYGNYASYTRIRNKTTPKPILFSKEFADNLFPTK